MFNAPVHQRFNVPCRAYRPLVSGSIGDVWLEKSSLIGCANQYIQFHLVPLKFSKKSLFSIDEKEWKVYFS